jgi:hypothetical protein
VRLAADFVACIGSDFRKMTQIATIRHVRGFRKVLEKFPRNLVGAAIAAAIVSLSLQIAAQAAPSDSAPPASSDEKPSTSQTAPSNNGTSQAGAPAHSGDAHTSGQQDDDSLQKRLGLDDIDTDELVHGTVDFFDSLGDRIKTGLTPPGASKASAASPNPPPPSPAAAENVHPETTAAAPTTTVAPASSQEGGNSATATAAPHSLLPGRNP